jgi:phosphatidylserine/phosphatidylglycerophosphate/cardiolipin synthase-like enzyme
MLLLVAALITVGYLWQTGALQRWLAGSGIPLPDIAAGPASPPPPPPVAVGDGTIQPFFTTPSLVYPDVPAQRVMTPIEQALIADIDAATRSIDLVTFEYNLHSIDQALVRAHQRGVRVQVALDRENLEKPPMAKWAGNVEAAGIPISWQDAEAFLHSKFVIIDDALVWTGSWNVTINDTYRNNNNLLRITVPAIVANYRAEFAQMFAGSFGNNKQQAAPNPVARLGNTVIENYFSPQDRQAQRVVDLIANAGQHVRFMAFAFTSDPIAEAMVARAQNGVPVEGVYETRNVEGTGSDFGLLRRGGVDVLEDGNCYTMHHKVIIVDDRIVITGSYNFTRSAEESNDENLLIIDDPTIAAQYIEEFQRVMAQARNPQRCQN